MKRLTTFISGFLFVCFLSVNSSVIFAQSIDSSYRSAGLILGIDYQRTSFFGSHVMNKSFDDCQGTNLSIGFSIYDKAEVLFTLGRMRSQLVDSKYVATSTELVKFRKARFRIALMSSGRITYLNPEFAFGVVKNNLQGDINGNLLEFGNNISFDVHRNMKLVGSIIYQRTKYDIETNAELLPLFDVSNAIVFSIGFQSQSQLTRYAKENGLRKSPEL